MRLRHNMLSGHDSEVGIPRQDLGRVRHITAHKRGSDAKVSVCQFLPNPRTSHAHYRTENSFTSLGVRDEITRTITSRTITSRPAKTRQPSATPRDGHGSPNACHSHRIGNRWALFAAGSASVTTVTSSTAATAEVQPAVFTSTSPARLGILTSQSAIQLHPKAVEATEAVWINRTPAPVETQTVAEPSVRGIPAIALAAYRNAELVFAQTQPGCGIDWSLFAGIGRIESGHASDGNTDSEGTTLTPILGPALDGTLAGNEVITDGQGSYARAVGPMQFLPSTSGAYASDGNGDGNTDPNNVFDAARYLCSGGLDLHDSAQRLRAVLRYNNSAAYASDVLGWASNYSGNGSAPIEIPTLTDATSETVPAEESRPVPESVAPPAESSAPKVPPAIEPAQPPMIAIPGLPPIPCGIFCPPLA